MAQGYECDRCGSLHSGKPDSRIELGDGVPRKRPRGSYHSEHPREGEPITEMSKTYDVCPGCRSAFETWWGEFGNTIGDENDEV